jgi:two-component system nitrate/nitrite response regulator NarL
MPLSDGRSSMEKEEPIRVLIVDDHEYVLWGLRKLIEGEWPRMTLAGTAKSIKDASEVLSSRHVDVAVLDLALDDEDGLELLPAIHAAQAAAVVLTGSRRPEIHRRALDGGARTVVLKEEPASVLLDEIQRAHEWHKAPRMDAAREQDCRSAVKARIAGFLLSTTRR